MGRPALWGLAQDGENGVKKILNIIKTEFDYTLALTGTIYFHLPTLLNLLIMT